jgi:tetratricopeptide (TPR) repeat protein
LAAAALAKLLPSFFLKALGFGILAPSAAAPTTPLQGLRYPDAPPRIFVPRHVLALLAALALAGCESAEEKAERYYLSGMELLAAGDEERALVEFRNVFKYNGFHKEARKVYADTVLKQGKVQEAYSQYLRLIEQYPDTPEVRLTLAELAIARGDWEEAERHGSEAVRLAPDAPGVPAVALALAYRKAVMDRDEAARATLAEDARPFWPRPLTAVSPCAS